MRIPVPLFPLPTEAELEDKETSETCPEKAFMKMPKQITPLPTKAELETREV